MSDNNSSDTSIPACSVSDSFLRSVDSARFVCYEVFAPLYVIVSVPVNAFVLAVLIKQTMSEGAYAFQLCLAVGKALEMLSMILLVYSLKYAGLDEDGLDWFQRTYFLMFYTAHLAILFNQFSMNASLYIAICMSAERLYALIRPLRYQIMNRRRYLLISLTISLLIGIGSSAYNATLFYLEKLEDGRYQLISDVIYSQSVIGIVMTAVANFVRIFGLITLISSNALLVHLFHSRFAKVDSLFASVSSDTERKRKAKERTLILLNVCQSTFCCLTMASETLFYSAVYFVVEFFCYSSLWVSVLNVVLQIVNMIEAVAPFLVSQQMRFAAKRLCLSATSNRISSLVRSS